MGITTLLNGYTDEEDLKVKLKKKINIQNLHQLDGAVLFGASELGKRFALQLKKNRVNLKGFSDNNRKFWGKKIGDLFIMPPGNIKKDDLVIITSKSVLEIYDQLNKLGVKKVLGHLILTSIFPEEFPNILHKNAFKLICKNKRKIISAYNLLSDQESKKIFFDILAYRQKLLPEYLPKISKETIYFPKLSWTITKNETFVDVGAYDGDTFKEFIKQTVGKFNKYIALEPDRKNYNKFLKAIPGEFKQKVVLTSVGAGDENQTVNFNATGGLDSRVSKKGENRIKICKLDDLCSDEVVTMVKMDVEGHEPKVISGMSNILKKSKPKLAVCIYHRPDHLWELPLLIARINPSYKKNFFIRHHHKELFETVLYCY